jgi:hypothetical protein
MPLLEQLGQVVIIHPGIPGTGESHHVVSERLGKPPGRGPSPIPMREDRDAVLPQAGEEPPDMPHRQAQYPRGCCAGQRATLHLAEDLHALLLLRCQHNRPPDHDPRVTDSLAC